MDRTLRHLSAHPVPNTTLKLNSVWGCILMGLQAKPYGRNEFAPGDSSDNRKFVYAEICVFIEDL